MTSFDPNYGVLWGQEWHPIEHGWVSDPSGIHLWKEGQEGCCSLQGSIGRGPSPDESLQALLGDPIRMTFTAVTDLYPITLAGEAVRQYFSVLSKDLGTVTHTAEGWRLEASDQPYPSPEAAWEQHCVNSNFWSFNWVPKGYGWTCRNVSLRRRPTGWCLQVGRTTYEEGHPTREACLAAYFGAPKMILGTLWYPWSDGVWYLADPPRGIPRVTCMTCKEGLWTNLWIHATRHETPEECLRELVAQAQSDAYTRLLIALGDVHQIRELTQQVGAP